MWNRRTLVASIFSSFVLLQAPVVVSAADSPQLACRRSIETSLSRWSRATLRARLQCLDAVIERRAEPSTDCIVGAGFSTLSRKLAAATANLERRIATGCEGADWGLLSYPGPCEAFGSPFTATVLANCISTVGTDIQQQLFGYWYPAPLEVPAGAALDCAQTVPRRASDMLLRELAVRLRCSLAFEASGGSDNVDCLALPAPQGYGTGSAVVDDEIFRAQRAWLGSMPGACSKVAFDELGYGASCDPPVDAGAAIIDFQSCVYRANKAKMPSLVDLAFPSDPVCGNGILQEGEICDDGPGNSDTTPDACREDCTNPFCGDSTTDPGRGEQCDDGNASSLDGCTPSCVREFCGDGITNNLPNENCDDGNGRNDDRCTTGCKAATCGDGFVCTDASCSSGPGGGIEICDNGSGNASNAICKPDCSGFTRSCVLTIGVTNSVSIGALTYEMSYKDADGEVVGSGAGVQCTSSLAGALTSFNDNEVKRAVKESAIIDAGLETPATLATCNYWTNDAGLAPSDFSFSIQAASDPQFNPIDPVLAVTTIACQ